MILVGKNTKSEIREFVDELVCIPCGTHHHLYEWFIPHDAYAAPRDRHAIIFFQIIAAGCQEHPLVTPNGKGSSRELVDIDRVEFHIVSR